MKEMGERLRRLRKLKSITQEELAEQMGVSRQSVSKWESDQSVPELDKIINLSEYYGTTTDYLLLGRECDRTAADSTCETEGRKVVKRNINLIASAVMAILSGLSLFTIWVLSKIYPINNLPYNSETGLYRVGLDAFTYIHGLKDFYTLMSVVLVFSLLLAVYSILRRAR